MAKAEVLAGMRGQGLNDQEIAKRMLEALDIPDVGKLLEVPEPQPPFEVTVEMEKIKIEWMKLQLEMAKFAAEQGLTEAEIFKTMASAIESVAKAEAAEAGPQLDLYKTHVTTLGNIIQNREKVNGDIQRGFQSMENRQQGNEGGVPGSQGTAG
jgi:hypothetical protein